MKVHIRFVFLALLLAGIYSCQEKATEYREILSIHPNGQEELVRTFSIRNGDTLLLQETMFWENGKMRVDGKFDEQGLKHGTWTAWYENGNKWSEGNFVQGKTDGDYRAWHENGQIYYQGSMRSDERVGTWQFFTPDGKLSKEIKY